MTHDILLGLLMGVGLSAACGFRVFAPFLVVSAAALSGHLKLGAGFEWIASYPALIAFGAATLFEVGAYFIPWLDHLLDVLATPVAVVAGTVMTASQVVELSPFLKWTVAIIAGGGVAGLVQGGTTLLRGASTVATGGFANPLVALGELAASLISALVALAMPFLIVFLILTGLLLLLLLHWRRRERSGEPTAPAEKQART